MRWRIVWAVVLTCRTANATLSCCQASLHSTILPARIGLTGLPQSWGVAVEQIPAAERAGKLVGRIAALRSSVGIGDNVRQFGVAKTDVARLAGFALQDACMATNPKPMERRDVEAIYEAII